MTNKKISESDDYTGENTTNAACNTKDNDQNGVDGTKQENQNLREKIKELENELKRTNELAEQGYNDLLDSVSTLTKRVHSNKNQ